MLTLKSRILKYLALFLSAVMVSMGFPGYQFPTLNIGFILPFALVPLFIVIETLPKFYTITSNLKPHSIAFSARKRALHAFFAFWFFGFIVQLFAFFWISSPIIYFSTIKPIVAYPLYVFICLLTSLYFPFIFSPLIVQTWLSTRHHNKKIPLALIAMIIVFLEMTAPRFFAWTFGSLMSSEQYVNQLSSIFGFHAISFFIFFTNLALSKAIINFLKNRLLFLLTIGSHLVIWLFIIVFGYYKIRKFDHSLQNLPTTRIAYVQPNFTFSSVASLQLPTEEAHSQSLSYLIRLSYEAIDKAIKADGRKPDLLVWPESATQGYFTLDYDEINITKRLANATHVPILVQATKWDKQDLKLKSLEDVKVWSASFLIRPDGSLSKEYEKWIPMPFGEHLPLENFFPSLGVAYRKIFTNASKLEVGKSYDALGYSEKHYVAPLICFDSIYAELPRLQAAKGKASIFVNQANFIWMVDSNAGLEFSVLNQFRAIENSRSLIMVTNSGPTMAFDPLGRVILPSTQILTQSTGFVDVPISEETTLYSIFSDWPLRILGGIALIWSFLIIRNKST